LDKIRQERNDFEEQIKINEKSYNDLKLSNFQYDSKIQILTSELSIMTNEKKNLEREYEEILKQSNL